MAKLKKLLEHILMRKGDSNVSFTTLCSLLNSLGFSDRIRGDHHIFTKDGVEEILNIQPKGGKAKAYQVKQVRDIIIRYSMNTGE
nr:type II toxin-antitoxin system HicA family toxin [Desulfobulbaceae bacterium]